MAQANAVGSDRREFERFTVPPMYSSIQIVRRGRFSEGHLYNVSLGGMRFELDRALTKGAEVDVDFTLPGCADHICAKARVVRVFAKDDDPGPRRMAVEFESFAEGSRAILSRYLAQKWLRPERDQNDARLAAMRSTNASRSSGSARTRSANAA